MITPKASNERSLISQILSASVQGIEQTETVIAERRPIKTGHMQNLLAGRGDFAQEVSLLESRRSLKKIDN